LISVEIDTKPDKNWNKRLLESGYGNIYQTEERASLLATENVPNYFLKFIDSQGNIVGQLLVSIRTRFKGNSFRTKLFKSTPGIKQSACEWSYGPVIFNSNFDSEIYLSLKDFLKSKRFVVNGWTHPLISTNLEILKKHFQIKPWGTFLINLEQPIDELYKNLDKHSCRKNIERSIKRGVIVEQMTDESLSDYYDLINEMRVESGREKGDFEYLVYRWKTFKSLGYSGFMAKKNNRPVGGLLFSYMNGHIIEIGVARSKEDRQDNLYSQDLIKWKIIEWGIKNKMKYYDLTGFNPDPISEKEKGIIKYKKKWGGKPHYYYRILPQPNILTGKL
jgi:hypothetical protein